MAYDEMLAARVRTVLSGEAGYSERTMFGGIAFMLHGNMACGIVKDDLMVRVGPDAHDALVRQPHAREMDFAGRPMRGMLYVGPPGVAADDGLRIWVGRAATFVLTLPPKPEGGKAAKATKGTAKGAPRSRPRAKAKPRGKAAALGKAKPAARAASRGKAKRATPARGKPKRAAKAATRIKAKRPATVRGKAKRAAPARGNPKRKAARGARAR